jgi:7,8-dihydro-6-hydroxymethylpterin dimethyltransferase
VRRRRLEHGYWASANASGRGSFVGHDPYCELYKGLARDAFDDARRRGPPRSRRVGFDRPVVMRGMGERTLHDEQAIVRTTHSACVLSEEVADRSRAAVRSSTGTRRSSRRRSCAARQPDAEDLAHIPPEVVERFYGCGSPVSAASPQHGETLLDLGSGAGIDCFIAAKRRAGGPRLRRRHDRSDAGRGARVAAARCRPRSGYDNVEFRKGSSKRSRSTRVHRHRHVQLRHQSVA